MKIFRKRTHQERFWRWLLIAAAVWCTRSAPAFATLGEDASSIAADQARMQATARVLEKDQYSVHELALDSGGTVREYVNDSGKVFAVAWSGGWRPNLRELMGKHYQRYLGATQCKQRVRGPSRIEHRGLVVVMGGHPRAFFGKAYLNSQLPPNVRIADIH